MSQHLVTGGLQLHRGDDIAERVDKAAVEFKKSVGGGGQRFALFGGAGAHDMLRHIVRQRIKADDGGIFQRDNFLLKNVERHSQSPL